MDHGGIFSNWRGEFSKADIEWPKVILQKKNQPARKGLNVTDLIFQAERRQYYIKTVGNIYQPTASHLQLTVRHNSKDNCLYFLF